jgi:hypothetical protein
MCDDIETTLAELRAKGTEFEGGVVAGWWTAASAWLSS